MIKAKYVIESWNLQKLIALLKSSEKMELNPEYQRNAIWTVPVQRQLIETILSGMPLPSFFIRRKVGGKFEMVDGQQRSRAIKEFYDDELKNEKGQTYRGMSDGERTCFLDYVISVVTLDVSLAENEVRDFYVLVNSSGVKLNRAELRKAEYHHTRLLALCNELANDPIFQNLNLFTEKASIRMSDVDFISELVTYLISGITDKKISVETAYAEDVSETQVVELRKEFKRIMGIVRQLDDVVRLSETRLRQKADFYTLFGFIHENKELQVENFVEMYRLLILLDDEISPSQDECEPLKEYALACVSQSNSKKAREQRKGFFNNMFLNADTVPTIEQMAVVSHIKGRMTLLNGFLIVDSKNSSI